MTHIHNVYDTDTYFSIDPITRGIRNLSSKKTTLMQNDHNSERFTFELPRFIEGHDMSLCNEAEVHYLNISNNKKDQRTGRYAMTDLKVSPDDNEKVICSWLISQNATQLVGALTFRLRFKCLENNVITYAWHTAIHTTVMVSDGINADESFEMEYVDIIEQWKEAVKNEITTNINAGVSEWAEVESGKVRGEMTAFSAEWNALLAVERKRIDAFVALPEGATQNDAELQDIRIGADGVTYPNAGDAVRGQANNLMNELHSVHFENLLTPIEYADNVSLGSDGMPATNEYTLHNSTCRIPVQKGMCVSIIGEHINRLCLYDLNDVVIPGSIMTNDTKGKTTIVHQDGFLRFTIVSYKGHTLYQPKEDVKIRIKQVNNNNLVTPRIFGSQYLYEPNYKVDMSENSTIDKTGGIGNNGNYNLTDFIPVEPLDVLSIYYAPPVVCALFDENKNFIKAIESGVEGFSAFSFKVPYNAVYARFNISKRYADRYSVVYGEEAKEIPDNGTVMPWFMPTPKMSKWEDTTFCTLGDSITWQDGKAYGQGDVGAIARGYQTVIKEKLLFAKYDNYGVSGAPVANGSENGAGTVSTAQTVDYSKYDLCIIAGGTNDFKLDVSLGNLGTIGASAFDDTTFCGAYQKMIEHILTQNPAIRICLFTPLHRNKNGYNINTINKAGHRLIDYVNVIKSIGEMYSLPVCDIYANSGINTLNLSEYTMDGLHPNDAGYARMGEYCVAFLKTI